MTKTAKKWFQSKTVWSGILKTLAWLVTGLAQLLAGDLNPQTFTASVLTAIWGIYDIIIRFKTSQAIK